MNNKKLKKYTLRIGIIFLIILALLTYFSKTIDNMLLPQVKVTNVTYGSLDGLMGAEEKYLVPISSVCSYGETGYIFAFYTDEETNTVEIDEIEVNITGNDDFYYEITSDMLKSSYKVVYSTSKSIADGDRVYIVED